ncbi:hypothetical protein RclHR1_06450001 [Rhizophagus clarus]|uniref:Protein kinase domain-containing protein n=1 Tax=Rhizophagus clarus TaxID=94130 RepID=A0A2Z6RY26_9GLOM|nr:hypothetical protein RclHR1_06450001 [Rhizophagus clarus]
MSTLRKKFSIKKQSSGKKWIEEKIKNEYVHYFEYDNFSQIDKIGSGSFGEVYKASLANRGLVALKMIFNEHLNIEDDVINKFIEELKLLRKIDYHQNINRILGITKDAKLNYILVLEYANEGNLREYLKEKFTSLEWSDKIQMALNIANGLKFLHSKEIIHRDLHSKNILVNDRKLSIADFGLSKSLAEATTNSVSNKRGIIEYIEPQCLGDIMYKKDKKSDIYSLGVLLWEISSGKPPFSGCPRELLKDHIKDGYRATPIEGTPSKYQTLYQECWDGEPKSRPNIEEVNEILSQLNTEDNKNEEPKSSRTDSYIDNKPESEIQDWFNDKYSEKKNINIVGDKKSKFKGSLKIKDFEKLKKISLQKFDLINLEISDCSKLTKINLSELSLLTSLFISKCSKLTKLNCSSKELTSLKISDCSRLKNFDLSGFSKLESLSVTKCPVSLDRLTTELTSLEINSSLFEDIGLRQLTKLESLTVIDCLKLNKFDYSSNKLTILKIRDCHNLDDVDLSRLPNLTILSVIDCLKLTKLDCSSIESLTKLEVNGLIELNCSNTSIEELSLNLCPKIERLECSNNSKLINLDVSNCSNLKSLNCSGNNLTSLDLSHCPKSINVIKSYGLIITRKKEYIKNILIVGRTGSGKSTLANVLTNTNKFKESVYTLNEARYFMKQEFKWKENYFRVIDTIGNCQGLFVIDGEFTIEEINAFNMIKDSILEIKTLDYITLVKTKFINFRSREECDKDIERMKEESEFVVEIIDSCNDVIHVDFPLINNEEIYDDVTQISKETREMSRKLLLDYLENVPPVKKNEYFKLKTWDKLRIRLKRCLQILWQLMTCRMNFI